MMDFIYRMNSNEIDEPPTWNPETIFGYKQDLRLGTNPQEKLFTNALSVINSCTSDLIEGKVLSLLHERIYI